MMKRMRGLIDMPVRDYVSRLLICIFFMVIYTSASLAFPSFITIIIDKGVSANNTRNIILYSCEMLGIGVIMIVFQYLQRMGFYKLAQRIILSLKEKLVKKILLTNLNFWKEHKAGDIFTILESDVSQLETMFTTTISDILVNFFVVIGISGYLIYINRVIGILVVFLAVTFSFVQRKIGRKIELSMYVLREKVGDLSSYTNEILNNVISIQGADFGKIVTDKYNKKNKEVIVSSIHQLKIISYTQIVGMVFNTLGIFIVLIVGAMRVRLGTMSIGLLFSLTIYVQRVYGPVVSLGDAYITIRNTIPIIDKIYAVLGTEELIKSGNKRKNTSVEGKIEFRDITFAYDKNERGGVFSNLNIIAKPGQNIGIVGENGSGKTTLLKLLMRVCEPNQGKILLDDIDIKEYELEYFREQFAYMLQNPYLMSGKLRDILNPFGKNIADAQINQMIAYFGLNMERFEQGLDTEIGENKLDISGGEAQKISLIRLFLEEKPVYILDEPTAAIDMESENFICDKLKNLLQGKTAFIITHREKILEICDDVYRL